MHSAVSEDVNQNFHVKCVLCCTTLVKGRAAPVRPPSPPWEGWMKLPFLTTPWRHCNNGVVLPTLIKAIPIATAFISPPVLFVGKSEE